VPSIRFRLDHPSLDGVADKARERYGADARVLSAEEVRVGGIGGFFARRFIDVVVEVPDGPSAPWTATRSGSTGGGLQELLDRAEATETMLARWTAGGGAAELERFGSSRDQLMAETRAAVVESREHAEHLVDWFLASM
jgi:hypothetical protein